MGRKSLEKRAIKDARKLGVSPAELARSRKDAEAQARIATGPGAGGGKRRRVGDSEETSSAFKHTITRTHTLDLSLISLAGIRNVIVFEFWYMKCHCV
jgi:hypothetical protein